MKIHANMLLIAAIAVMTAYGCKKDDPAGPAPGSGSYSSLDDFYKKNAPPMQSYIISAESGGTLTTPQGTTLNIPPNSFRNMQGMPVTGTVKILFKDLYKKSDMLLAGMPTQLYTGAPLVSAGEFFIMAKQGNEPLLLMGEFPIDVLQPFDGAPDSLMQAFLGIPDSANNLAWGYAPSADAQLFYTAQNYVYSLYSFSTPAAEGTWCNSDNSSYFGNLPQTALTLTPPNGFGVYETDVFLVFEGVNSMVHVYPVAQSFAYYYAPVGFQCTVVALSVKDGKLFSSFTPITISSNQTVNLTISETTTEDFKSQLEALK